MAIHCHACPVLKVIPTNGVFTKHRQRHSKTPFRYSKIPFFLIVKVCADKGFKNNRGGIIKQEYDNAVVLQYMTVLYE